MINQDKPTNSLSNSSKVSIGETWGSITTTWASETRTWLAASQLIANSNIGATGFLWSFRRFPWTETSPWLSEGGISNVNKP